MIYRVQQFLHKKVQREGIDKDPALFEAGLLTLNDYVCLSKRLDPIGGGLRYMPSPR